MSGHPMGYRSSLAKHHTTRRPPEQVARDGWRDQRILVVGLNDPRLDDIDRGMVTALAVKLFGKGAR